MPPLTAQQLCFDLLLWRHFTWQLWVGTAIWASLVALVCLYQYVEQRSFILHDDFYAPDRAASLSRLAGNTLALAVMLSFSGFVLALVGGLVRQPFLAALSRRARSAGALVWQSLVLFELLVCVLALIPWPIAYNTFGLESFGRQLRALFVLSLPWLASTGLASWQLASALRAVPTDEAANRPTRVN